MTKADLNRKGVQELEDLVRSAIEGRDRGTLQAIRDVLERRKVARSVRLRDHVDRILSGWEVEAAYLGSAVSSDGSGAPSSDGWSPAAPQPDELGQADGDGHLDLFGPDEDSGVRRRGKTGPPGVNIDLSWLQERAAARDGDVRFRFDETQVKRFLMGIRQPDTAEWFHLRSQAERIAMVPGFEELIALDANTIEELAHQTDTATRVLQQMNGRAILADEVGLGKTIEAGLIAKELLVRRLVRRILIICPAALTDQWREEMHEKFLIEFEEIENRSQWRRAERVIVSLSKARNHVHGPRLRRKKWDLVIVDEAHKAKNHRTAAYRTINGIERDFMLLLTATPLQNHLREFFNLVTLIRPGQFGTWTEFRRRHLTRGSRIPRDPTAIRDLASEVMIRNKRANVDLKLPRRIPHRPSFTLTPGEQELYDESSSFLRALYSRGMYPDEANPGAKHFVLNMMAQRVCSSSMAIATSLGKLQENQNVRPEFRSRAARLASKARSITSHAKLRALDAALATHPGERIVVFSEHRPTIDLIDKHLSARGRPVFLYHGGKSRQQKARMKKRFRETPASVLVSSRSGTEGLNLQFAHVLVNYELPWNPLIVEQRIGRLHRIGQENEVVIYNLAATGTVEDRILEVLQEKIRLFELVVGELDLILGRFDDATDLEQRFITAWLEASDEQAFETEVRKIEREVEESFREGKEAEEMSSYIAPEDNAERLERDFGALRIPARIRLAWGTRHHKMAPGVDGERRRIGLTVSEIQAALTNAPEVDHSGMSDYGPAVWIHSATGRGRAVSLRVAADGLPVVVLEIRADEEAPLLPEDHS